MLLVFNPRSGKEQIRGQPMEILNILTRVGYELRVHVTQKQKDAMDVVVRLGKKVGVMVYNGGDGTLNETISGVMKLKKMSLLGYIPADSTNDFATSLGISKRIPLTAWDIVEGTPFATDTGTSCEGRSFIYIATFEAFMKVSYLTSQDGKSFLGHQAYMLEGVKSLAGLKPYRIEVGQGGQVPEENLVFGMVTGAISMGEFRGLMDQSVALSSDLLEVLLIRVPGTPVDLSSVIPYMSLREEPNRYVYKFKTLSIRPTSEQEVDWVLDGEYGGSRTEVTIGNIRENIQILLRNHPEEESGRKQIE